MKVEREHITNFGLTPSEKTLVLDLYGGGADTIVAYNNVVFIKCALFRDDAYRDGGTVFLSWNDENKQLCRFVNGNFLVDVQELLEPHQIYTLKYQNRLGSRVTLFGTVAPNHCTNEFYYLLSRHTLEVSQRYEKHVPVSHKLNAPSAKERCVVVKIDKQQWESVRVTVDLQDDKNSVFLNIHVETGPTSTVKKEKDEPVNSEDI